MEYLENNHSKLSYTDPQNNFVFKLKFFDLKIKLTYFKVSQQVSSVILSCKEINKNIWKKIKRGSVLIKNGTIYAYMKNWLHRKYKDFQFSISNDWKASEKDVTKCLGENVWRWLVHLVSRFACNGRIKRAQIHHLHETNYCNKI